MTNRRWIFALLGILISTFLGGMVRVYFSPARVRDFVLQAALKKQPKFEFEFSTAQLKLADGWWPLVAIEFTNLKVQAKDTCITHSSLHVDKVTIPLQLNSLFSKRLKFGHIHGGDIQFFYRQEPLLLRDAGAEAPAYIHYIFWLEIRASILSQDAC